MLVDELDAMALSLDQIRDKIWSLKDVAGVLVLHRGAHRFNRDQWKQILQNTCGLALDRRQYNYKEQMELTDWWEISYQPDRATSYAYSNTRQPLHNDNAWFADPAEINFFIVERQASSGGEQTLYPLSRLLEDLSSDNATLLADLSRIPVTIKKGDGEYSNHTPIIVAGDHPKIFWNYYRTEKPTPEIQSMCDAFFRYLEWRESTSSVERRRSETGDCICFNDQKLLHGRAAFAASKPYDRILLQSMWRF